MFLSLSQLQGTDVNLPDTYGSTALHWSAYEGCIASVRWLLEDCKANPHVTNKFGDLALHSACMEGQFEIARELLAAGLNPVFALIGVEAKCKNLSLLNPN